MRVLTLLGTRPELIRLSLIIPKLDKLCDHVLVHTGQNYDYGLDGVFQEELGIRKPDYYLKAKGTFADQLSIIASRLEKIIAKDRPDAFLVLGDTNSSLGAIVAKRMGIKVFHMEAGNRCHDERSPEEVNRRIIDHCTDIHMPYTELSRQNLLREGIPAQDIYVIGNPIKEVIDEFTQPLKQTGEPYYLATLHRQENVDDPTRLKKIIQAYSLLDRQVVWSVHPRTLKQLGDRQLPQNVYDATPFGFSDFIGLERNAICVLTDSGTVQEECAIFGTPCVTLRDSTERPETLESGSNIISGCEPEAILRAVRIATTLKPESYPEEYSVVDVSNRVVKIVLGYNR